MTDQAEANGGNDDGQTRAGEVTDQPASAAETRLRGHGSQALRRALQMIVVLAAGTTVAEWALLHEAHFSYGWLIEGFAFVGLTCTVVGVWLWRRRPANGTGLLLTVLGVLVLAAATGNVPNRWFSLIGSLSAETPIAAIAHVVLAFPSGVLRDRWSKRLVVLAYLSSVAWQVPIFVFSPDSAGFSWLHVDGHASLTKAADNAQSIVSGAVLVGALLVLVRRWRATKPLAERRVLGLAFGYGIIAVASFPLSAQVFRRVFDWSAYTLFGVQLLIVLGIPFVLAAAMLSGALARTVEIDELATWLASDPSQRTGLRDALADALGDPSLQLLHELRDTNTFVDAAGNVVDLPAGDRRRRLVTIEAVSGRAVIVYDGELIADPAPVEAAGRVVALAIDHERVTAELRASQAALRSSRLRILEHGEEQRRQLAQDLHDGLQGRLVLAAIHAGQLAVRVGDTDAARLRDEIGAAVQELRRMVHGVLPPLMIEQGLFAAVEELVDRVPLRARTDFDDDHSELPWAVALAGYFIVAEAIANTVKHADAASVEVVVRVRDNVLHIGVHDDGVGGATTTGAGLRSMADRVATLAGTLHLDSPTGGGTMVTAELPCGL